MSASLSPFQQLSPQSIVIDDEYIRIASRPTPLQAKICIAACVVVGLSVASVITQVKCQSRACDITSDVLALGAVAVAAVTAIGICVLKCRRS
jgi:hypothetical protein